MLSFFPRITAADAQSQHQRLLAESAAAAATAGPCTIQRAPGRPRQLLDANRVLAAAAAAVVAPEEPPAKRAKYANWFASPLIHDILAAYKLNDHSAKKTVSYLQRTYPRLATEHEGQDIRVSSCNYTQRQPLEQPSDDATVDHGGVDPLL
jgi:hypothetical protein